MKVTDVISLLPSASPGLIKELFAAFSLLKRFPMTKQGIAQVFKEKKITEEEKALMLRCLDSPKLLNILTKVHPEMPKYVRAYAEEFLSRPAPQKKSSNNISRGKGNTFPSLKH